MQEILWRMYIGSGEEEVKDYKGNVKCLSLFELDDSSTLHGTSDLLIVSPSGMILEEVGGFMWVSFLPFSPDVVQLFHRGQMTTNHLQSSADKSRV